MKDNTLDQLTVPRSLRLIQTLSLRLVRRLVNFSLLDLLHVAELVEIGVHAVDCSDVVVRLTA